jgi:hypothetical protein
MIIRKILFVLAAMIVNALALSAQETIVTKDGSSFKGNVLEVDRNTVKYRLSDEPTAPVYSIRKSDVLMIKDALGGVDVISSLKYKELKNIYDYRDWSRKDGGRYSPALMGFCSWIVPGLGQMISGEGARGAGWLAGSVGCAAVAGAGAGMYLAYTNDNSLNPGYYGVGMYMAILGAASLVTLDICAIVDAYRVAKVKNLYDQSVRTPKYSLELHPSVDYIRMADGVQPTAGLSLALKF